MTKEAKRPWWQVTRTPRSGFVLAGLWCVMAVLRWVTRGPDDGTFSIVLAVLFSAIAAWILASSVALHRRRSAADALPGRTGSEAP